MITEKTWEEFRACGLLWWINMILHTFGWAICVDIDKQSGKCTKAFPARVKYRGFYEAQNDEGYTKITQYLKDHAVELLDECEPLKGEGEC